MKFKNLIMFLHFVLQRLLLSTPTLNRCAKKLKTTVILSLIESVFPLSNTLLVAVFVDFRGCAPDVCCPPLHQTQPLRMILSDDLPLLHSSSFPPHKLPWMGSIHTWVSIWISLKYSRLTRSAETSPGGLVSNSMTRLCNRGSEEFLTTAHSASEILGTACG